ncbi:MAG TPA: hypothetical protein VFA20_07060 [Myxococcaceae bacterium]|nr:hypothetical protein [Myxococcaceae bacterium]
MNAGPLLALALAPSLAWAQLDAGTDAGQVPGAIESFDPIESFDNPPPTSGAGTPDAGPPRDTTPRLNRTWAELTGLVGLDTRFEPPPTLGTPEDILEGQFRATAGADLRLSDAARLVLEARARWRGLARAGLTHARADVEARLGDAYLDLYSRWADLRVGWQRVPLGANALLGPEDAFNPRDLRDGFIPAGLDPESSILTVLALRAQGELGPVRWLLAYAPFFEPDRYAVFGQDQALLQPAAEVALPFQLDPSIEDGLQAHLLETARPPNSGLSGDLAARARVDLGGRGHAGAGWLWATEKLPQVQVDPELAAAIKAQSLGRPVDPAILLSLQNRLAAGESLYRGTYPRQHTFWLEGSAILGPVQADLDLAFSPARTFGTDGLTMLRLPSLTWVAGISPAEQSDLVYSASYLGMAIPGVPADDLLFPLEPATARGAARTAWLHLLVVAGSRKLLDGRLEVGGALAFEVVQRSLFLAPQVSYELVPQLRLGLGLEWYAGPPSSPFGYFDRNDRVLLSAVWTPR